MRSYFGYIVNCHLFMFVFCLWALERERVEAGKAVSSSLVVIGYKAWVGLLTGKVRIIG